MFNSAAIFGERLFLAVVPVQSSYRTMLVIGTILLLLLVALALALLYPALAKQMALWVWDRKLAAFVVVVGACVLGGILRTARPPFTTAPDSFRVDGDWPLDRGGLCRLGGLFVQFDIRSVTGKALAAGSLLGNTTPSTGG